MNDHAADVHRLSKASLVGQAILLLGLALVAVSFVVPFASNEAGCLDHCASAGSYFVWHPFHNPGALFLLIGVGSSLLLWRSLKWRRRVVTWLGAFLGWIGLYLYYRYAPEFVEELHLYGGPELQLRPTRWIAAYSWVMLQGGTVLYALGQPHAGRHLTPASRPDGY
jgi:hypothetical protein